jgi:hypothetical protein
MTEFSKWFSLPLFFALASSLANAQVGVTTGPPNSALACTAYAAGTPELRPEGFTELLGDIVVSCTGGSILASGTAIPTATLTVSLTPVVPITSRILNAATGLSEALLVIDEPGGWEPTGAQGKFGPNGWSP